MAQFNPQIEFDILHRCKKSVQIIVYGGEMGGNKDKDQTFGQDNNIIASAQREIDRASIKGRPNINEISKRNEETEKQERKSFYITTGIIVLLITAVVLLVYFFS